MSPNEFLIAFDLTRFDMPTSVALGIVAAMGYLVGRRRPVESDESNFQAHREMKRAQCIARDLEKIAKGVRQSLASHHASVARFKNRVSQLSGEQSEAAWKELCEEAEQILGPTMQLATQMATAYDEIRRQSNQLMTFTAARTDPLTGVSNRRAMDETLKSWVAMKSRYDFSFSIVILDIDHFKQVNDQQGHPAGDKVLKEVAGLMDECARDTDIVTRYGGEEFVVLMPQTDLIGATAFSERLRRQVEKKMMITISGGVAMVIQGESPENLLDRADSALYESKASGRNKISIHDGERVFPASELQDEAHAAARAAAPKAPVASDDHIPAEHHEAQIEHHVGANDA